MPGIQPANGVPPGQTVGSLANPDLAEGCDNLWYALRCNPRLDPRAMNSLISEIINLVNCRGLEYDCNRLDNLCLALPIPPPVIPPGFHILHGQGQAEYGDFNPPGGAGDFNIGPVQNINIPNSSGISIPVFLFSKMHIRIDCPIPDAQVFVTGYIDYQLASEYQMHVQGYFSTNSGTSGNHRQDWGSVSSARMTTIPPGGRVIPVRMVFHGDAGGQPNGNANLCSMAFDWYGVSSLTGAQTFN